MTSPSSFTLKKGFVVAIDGPAGTGKSSVTKRLADLLKFVHIDTGALYRSVAYLCIQTGTLMEVEPGLELSAEARTLASQLARTAQFEFRRDGRRNPKNRILINQKDVTNEIRTLEVSIIASKISAIPEVRDALRGLQRSLGSVGKSILEGRDIGTVIFPDADVKFFMTASVEERAKRRLSELEASGADTPSFEEVKKQIADRDHADSTRAVAPLKVADDALVIDTSQLTLDQVVDKMQKIILEKIQVKNLG